MSILRIFSSLISLNFAISIINCQNIPKELEECQNLFDIGADKRIKFVLNRIAHKIGDFKEITSPEKYFEILEKYKNAKKNYKERIKPGKVISEQFLEKMQRENNERKKIIDMYETFMKLLNKSLEVESGCLNSLKFWKKKTIKDGLKIIMNGKICCEKELKYKHSEEICKDVDKLLKTIGFKYLFPQSMLEQGVVAVVKQKYKPNLERIPEEIE